MRTISARSIRSSRAGLVAVVLGLLCLVDSCGRAEKDFGPTDGETHFLTICGPESSPCPRGLACLCGVCSTPCADEPACQSLAASATCVAVGERPTVSACTSSPTSAFCDVPCKTDEICSTLSPGHRCFAGYCRYAPGGSGAEGGASGGGGSGGVAGAGPCPRSGVEANQVLLLGDSFVALSHQMTGYLEELARASGSIGAGDRYRDNSSLNGNALALGTPVLADQYAAGRSESVVKVVIMDGGGADLVLGTCDSPVVPDCPVVVNAVAAANQLLPTMAQDGITDVVYFFYPDPVDAALRAKADVLRPLIEAACQTSAVPCHWVDLRPVFAGHYGEYILSDGMNPTAAGSQAAAAAVWAVMQRDCVAQ